MMPELGKYAGAVLGAYGASVALIVGLVVLSWWSHSKARAKAQN